jgi:pimeloyl-ACP methyl ester carboxylesterase
MAADTQALARLAFEELGGAIAGIGRIHRAVASRTPPNPIHDAVARGVYGGLRAGSRALGAGAALAVGRLETAPLADTRAGALGLGILNGLVGEALPEELTIPMTLRVEGERCDCAVVFLHGLMETDNSWGEEPYGARLAAELGCTPVYVRYNTGRHISENGAELAELLSTELDWAQRIALVGHSMGGLVARSAAHQAALAGKPWAARVTHVVSLGTPHMGAPLAQGVHWLTHTLDRLPETRPFADFFRRRSPGIRDLRHGSLVDADWRDRDPDALRAEACEEVPLLECATHCFVSATITRDARHPLGRLLGDILVLTPSATGRSRTRRLGFRDEDGFALGGAHHFALLDHPAVYERLRAWLSTSMTRTSGQLASTPAC